MIRTRGGGQWRAQATLGFRRAIMAKGSGDGNAVSDGDPCLGVRAKSGGEEESNSSSTGSYLEKKDLIGRSYLSASVQGEGC